MKINQASAVIAILAVFVSASGFTLGRPDEVKTDKYQSSKLRPTVAAPRSDAAMDPSGVAGNICERPDDVPYVYQNQSRCMRILKSLRIKEVNAYFNQQFGTHVCKALFADAPDQGEKEYYGGPYPNLPGEDKICNLLATAAGFQMPVDLIMVAANEAGNIIRIVDVKMRSGN